jgi:hypothetical protein
LFSVQRALADKRAGNQPDDYTKELCTLMALIKEIQDQNYYDDGSRKISV